MGKIKLRGGLAKQGRNSMLAQSRLMSLDLSNSADFCLCKSSPILAESSEVDAVLREVALLALAGLRWDPNNYSEEFAEIVIPHLAVIRCATIRVQVQIKDVVQNKDLSFPPCADYPYRLFVLIPKEEEKVHVLRNPLYSPEKLLERASLSGGLSGLIEGVMAGLGRDRKDGQALAKVGAVLKLLEREVTRPPLEGEEEEHTENLARLREAQHLFDTLVRRATRGE